MKRASYQRFYICLLSPNDHHDVPWDVEILGGPFQSRCKADSELSLYRYHGGNPMAVVITHSKLLTKFKLDSDRLATLR